MRLPLDDGPPTPDSASSRSVRPAVTIRSVGLGLIGAIALAVISPFNDYVVNNAFVIGSYFPPPLLVGLLLLLLGNALIRGVRESWALSRGELAVASLIVLIGCSVPGQGLMRSFLPLPVATFQMGRETPEFHDALVKMGLPGALFPVSSIERGDIDRNVIDFYGRVAPGEPAPLRGWIVPLLMWLVPIGAGAAMLIGTAYATRRQWMENERLSFPLATLHEQLIADPEPGRRLPPLLGSPLFWIGTAAVFIAQSIITLQPYFPRLVPKVGLYYDFRAMLTELPLRDLPDHVKTAPLYFTLIGIAYFIPTRASLSIWVCVWGVAVSRIFSLGGGIGISDAALPDQHFGGAIALTAAILWLGRHRYLALARHSLIPGSRGRHPGDDLVAAELWGFRVAVLGALGLSAWLLAVGVLWWVVLAIVGATWLCHLVTARIVAEVGLPFFRCSASSQQLVQLVPATMITPRDAYFAGVGNIVGSMTARESVLVFAQHADVVVSRSIAPQDRRSRLAWPGIVVATLLIVFGVSAFASLLMYYSYGNTLEMGSSSVENNFGLYNWPRWFMRDPVVAAAQGRWAAAAHSPLRHLGIGFLITATMAIGAARWAGWPLVPVGFLLATTWYGQQAWFSLLVGWIAKSLVVRLGGASLFTRLRPIFVGLIMGEALAVAFWLLVSSSRAMMGLEYYAVRILPQ